MVRRLAAQGQYVNRWAVASHSDPTKEYVVSQKADGSWGCACGGWIFNKERPRADCKHIKEIKHEEPVDMTKTSRKAAEAFARNKAAGRVVVVIEEPVFLMQTRRKIILRD